MLSFWVCTKIVVLWVNQLLVSQILSIRILDIIISFMNLILNLNKLLFGILWIHIVLRISNHTHWHWHWISFHYCLTSHKTFQGLCIIKVILPPDLRSHTRWFIPSNRASRHHWHISSLNKALKKRLLELILSRHFHFLLSLFSKKLLLLPLTIFSLLLFRVQFTAGSSLLIEMADCVDVVVKWFLTYMSVLWTSWSRRLSPKWFWWILR